MLGHVHLPPLLAIPLFAFALTILLLVRRRVAQGGLDPLHARVRRASHTAITLLTAGSALGLTVIDPTTRPSTYITIWSLNVLLVLCVFALGAIDLAIGRRAWVIARRIERAGGEAAARQAMCDGEESRLGS